MPDGARDHHPRHERTAAARQMSVFATGPASRSRHSMACFELVALVVAGRRDRRESSPKRAEQ